MPRRDLLHFNQLESFCRWLTDQGIEWRASSADFQVIQVRTRNGAFTPLYKKLDAKEHFSVPDNLEYLVLRYLWERKNAPALADLESAQKVRDEEPQPVPEVLPPSVRREPRVHGEVLGEDASSDDGGLPWEE